MPIHADLRQAIYALSDALDLVGVDDVAHGKRVGVMAAECAKLLGLSQDEQLALFDLGQLHDIGVSTTTTHKNLVSEFDWAGSQAHTVVGYELLKDFRPLARMALPIRYHHTRWDRLPAELPETVRRAANLIFLVDRVDALAAPYYASGQVLMHAQAIRSEIDARSGSYFDPALVDAFLRASKHEAFWLSLEPNALAAYLADMAAIGLPYETHNGELRQLGLIFARIVDAKSPFTFTHSRGVAQLARKLGERMGVSADHCDKLEIAGLLHDLGKLRVPDEVLDKPGPLDGRERLVIHSHSFETWQILRKIRGFEEIAAWAAHHHESPGRTGYPFGLDGAALPLEARILRVADIFQAMVQDRPYRAGLSLPEVRDFITDLKDRGSIDAAAGEMLLAHLDEMVVAARP